MFLGGYENILVFIVVNVVGGDVYGVVILCDVEVNISQYFCECFVVIVVVEFIFVQFVGDVQVFVFIVVVIKKGGIVIYQGLGFKFMVKID